MGYHITKLIDTQLLQRDNQLWASTIKNDLSNQLLIGVKTNTTSKNGYTCYNLYHLSNTKIDNAIGITQSSWQKACFQVIDNQQAKSLSSGTARSTNRKALLYIHTNRNIIKSLFDSIKHSIEQKLANKNLINPSLYNL